MFYHPLYRVWNQMKQRCLNPKVWSYYLYGGRGIAVCNEWLDFEPFCKWAMDNGYEENLTIDRKNSNGNYEPSNCKWSTKIEQANNRRTSRYITFNGKTMTVADWGRELKIDQVVLHKRLWRGWSIERTLNTPLLVNKNGN